MWYHAVHMMKTSLLLLAALVAAPASIAAADGVDPCVQAPPKKKKKKRKPPAPPAKKDCDCVGREGPPGPPGPKGDPGDGTVINNVQNITIRVAAPDSTISLAGGVMYAAYLPYGDWAWGPGLQLRRTDGDRLQLSLAVATASIADGHVGTESGWLAQLGLTKFDEDGYGAGVGLHITDIDGSPDNGNVDGRYIGLDVHLTYQAMVTDSLDLRFEVGPVLSYLRDDAEGRQVGLGLQSSLFLGGDL